SPPRTHPVGQKRPNAWGLHDIHGNVWEWCWDWYDPSYYKQMSTLDPTGPASGNDRVLRGGSFDSSLADLRSAYRIGYIPAVRLRNHGLRVARDCSPATGPQPIPPTSRTAAEFDFARVQPESEPQPIPPTSRLAGVAKRGPESTKE